MKYGYSPPCVENVQKSVTAKHHDVPAKLSFPVLQSEGAKKSLCIYISLPMEKLKKNNKLL